MDPVEKNIKIFAEEVQKFQSDYWRKDEEYLVNTYFKGKKNILVLGCGAGRTLPYLYQKGFAITAVDITPTMVEAAKKKMQDIPITITVMDACSLQFEDNSFDCVFFPFHGIDYIYPDIYKAIQEVHRVLKKDGVFIFNSHNRLFVKQLHRFFQGNYVADPSGLITYRTTPLDWFRLKKYFHEVKMIQRISIMVSWKNANWKDCLYKLMPLLNKSTYFVCMKKQ